MLISSTKHPSLKQESHLLREIGGVKHEFQNGELARLRKATPFWDRRKRYEGQWNHFPVAHKVRIFRIEPPEIILRFYVETLSTNYEARVSAEELIVLSPLEQLAEQSE